MGCPSDWYTKFGDLYSSTISNNMRSLNPCKYNSFHSPSSPISNQVLQILNALKILCHGVTFHMLELEAHWLSSTESYAGAIMINPFLSTPYGRPQALVSDNNRANVLS